MNVLRRHLLHSIDKVLARPEVSSEARREAVSLKKIKKGDGSWATRKGMLGWVVDTVRQTLELPPHRKEALAKIFGELKAAKRISAKRWSKILGKLRFVSIAIPGSSGTFSALQLALNRSKDGRIRITKSLRAHIDTLASLAASLSHRPTCSIVYFQLVSRSTRFLFLSFIVYFLILLFHGSSELSIVFHITLYLSISFYSTLCHLSLVQSQTRLIGIGKYSP